MLKLCLSLWQSQTPKGMEHGAASDADDPTTSKTPSPDDEKRISSIDQLPPLPIPKYETRRREVRCGFRVIFFFIFFFVSITHGVALSGRGSSFEKFSTEWWVFLCLIYGEAGLALLFLSLLLIVDPGVVHRSEESCFPVPPSVEAWILLTERRKKEQEKNTEEENDNEQNDADEENRCIINSLPERPKEPYLPSGVENGRADSPGATYCTRCLLWRPATTRHFHCTTCARCVSRFDHHCNVFGRCIAGDLFSGNMRYYLGLVILGGAACFTMIVSVVWSLTTNSNSSASASNDQGANDPGGGGW